MANDSQRGKKSNTSEGLKGKKLSNARRSIEQRSARLAAEKKAEERRAEESRREEARKKMEDLKADASARDTKPVTIKAGEDFETQNLEGLFPEPEKVNPAEKAANDMREAMRRMREEATERRKNAAAKKRAENSWGSRKKVAVAPEIQEDPDGLQMVEVDSDEQRLRRIRMQQTQMIPNADAILSSVENLESDAEAASDATAPFGGFSGEDKIRQIRMQQTQTIPDMSEYLEEVEDFSEKDFSEKEELLTEEVPAEETPEEAAEEAPTEEAPTEEAAEEAPEEEVPSAKTMAEELEVLDLEAEPETPKTEAPEIPDTARETAAMTAAVAAAGIIASELKDDAADEIVFETLSLDEPEETITEGPEAEEHVTEEPEAEEPAVEESAAEEPKTEEPKTEEPVPEEPVTEESDVEEPAVEEPVAEEPAAEAPAAEEPAAEESAPETPSVDDEEDDEDIYSYLEDMPEEAAPVPPIADKAAEAAAEAPVEPTPEAPKELTPEEKQKKKKKAMAIGGGLLAAALVGGYIGGSVYFKDHFYPNTRIGELDVACKTADDVKEIYEDRIDQYQLQINAKDGTSQPLKGADIGLTLEFDDYVGNLLAAQNGFEWPIKLFTKTEEEELIKVSFDQAQLKTAAEKLDCMSGEMQVMPIDAHLADYTPETGFVVVEATEGTAIDEPVLLAGLESAVNSLDGEMALNEIGAYYQPADISLEELQKKADILNEHSKAVINYEIGNTDKFVLDANTYANWLVIAEDGSVTLDESQVEAYVKALADKYDTYNKPKTLKTAGGSYVTISNVHYGWKVNQSKEVAALVEEITSGEAVTRDLHYSQTAASHGANDYGSSYVAVSISDQHLWLYKNGKLIVSTDVVTGKVSDGHSTPKGIWGITYCTTNAVLKGADYETPVSYWMPFNGGVGLHDAWWRGSFGGSIYMRNGSHGCVNIPTSQAKKVYQNVYKNYPVIVY